jgi:hypothetical protein
VEDQDGIRSKPSSTGVPQNNYNWYYILVVLLGKTSLASGQVQIPIQHIHNPTIFNWSLMIFAIFRRRQRVGRNNHILNRDQSKRTSLRTLTSPRLTIFLTRRTGRMMHHLKALG